MVLHLTLRLLSSVIGAYRCSWLLWPPWLHAAREAFPAPAFNSGRLIR